MKQAGAYSKEFLIAALQCVEVGAWHLDPGTGTLTWDSVAESFLGLVSPCDRSILLKAVLPQDRAAVSAFFVSARRLHDRDTVEFRVAHPDDGVRWLQCIGCALPGEGGSGEVLAGILQDISARKEAELRLEESQRQLRTLINNLQGVAYRCEADAPWRILYVSQGVKEVIGYDVAELEGQGLTWAELFHADDLADTRRVVEQAIAERQPFRLSYRLIHKSGAVRWVQECGEAVYDDEGRAIYLEGFISDISELVESQEVLRRAKEFLDVIIGGTPDGVFLKDCWNEGRYVLANDALALLAGRPAAEVIGHTDDELFPPDIARMYKEEDRRLAEKGAGAFVVEQALPTPQGQRLLEVRKFPLRNDDGELHYVLGIARDMTDQRALEVKVQRMQRMDAVGQLTGGIAHDFNNLLSIILGYGELLQESLTEPSLTGLADKIIEATERGSDLVRRLLVFARKQRLEPHAMNLNDRLPGVVDLLRRTLGENVRIALELGPDLWPVRVDASQVDDALVNLSINARDAMPEGGVLTIRTANVQLDREAAARLFDAEPGDYVMLAVSDTGHGMEPDVLARVFEPFFTTKEQGRGTGLGLAMIYGFAQQSGGHVDIASKPGQGTTVALYFPRAAGEAHAKENGTVSHDVTGGEETILLVEDNDSVRAMAMQQLRRLGYHVLEAANATEALAIIEQGAKLDLLFTDIVMAGGMSGYQLAERVHALRPELEILFTTGYDSPSTSHPPDKVPADKVLHKPYRRHELANAIRKALDRRDTAQG